MNLMNANFSLNLHDIHLWRAWLPDLHTYEADFLPLLSADEATRAARFRFPIHRLRFILARGILRQILSVYTNMAPQDIEFSYGPRGKPYLIPNPLDLQFNVSHSHDLAVFAITRKHEIGVDTEKMEDEYNDAVVERFFSQQEHQEINQLPVEKRHVAFFQIWSAKEALIKALGEGLFIGLDEFTLSSSERVQTLLFSHENKEAQFHIENFAVHPDYQAAYATDQKVEKIVYWQWGLNGPELCARF